MRWSEQGVQVIARAGRHLAVALTLCLGACANGEGEGEVSGSVSAPECGIDDTAWELRPDFFVQDPWENTAVIRVQRGSNYQDLSNGLVISISDVEEVRGSFGTPIDLSAEDSPVTITLTLDGTCRPARRDPSVVLIARSGTITFTALYDPRSDDGPETTATIDGLVMDDGEEEPSTAELSGYFTFLFARGRPGQRYP
ncbi:MAG: hypothetical protein IPL19_12350 [Sandaracinaceae bacterium]|nr:hypothetical protein [Sandaracinaceae bacterium]MBK8408762.1 hypothetical protein [Sandaracinaceae bacterium]MBK8591520.1 hypothetical protein [Sandaracinaceae bacterium]